PLSHSTLLPVAYPFPKSSPTGTTANSIAFPSSPSAHAREKEPMMINPRHALMRSRRVSLPANLVQTNYYSIVGGGAVGASVAAQNRMSVASFSSFESTPEEGESEETPPPSPVELDEASASIAGVAGSPARPGLRPRLSRRSASPTPGVLPSARLSVGPSSLGNGANPSTSRVQRQSSPTPSAYNGAYQSFAIPQTLGRTSPLGRSQSFTRRESEELEPGVKKTKEEKMKRADRRWRIALELRETERSYLGVLQEVDKEYYQPLLAALPVSDLAARRAARSSSQPTSPIVGPTRGDSTPAIILSRKEIGEIFSNFTDVLTLSNLMLSTLDEAIPDRPTDPVAVNSTPLASPLLTAVMDGSTPELSSSGDTVYSVGPRTPQEPELLGEASHPTEEDKRTALLGRTSTKREKERKPTPPPIRLGTVLIPILPYLKSYSLFIANFSGSLQRLSALEAAQALVYTDATNGTTSGDDKARWKRFCEEKKRRGVGKGLSLSGLLLNIVQRVPRYRYLLDDMLRHTERDHPDWKDLNSAFELVDQVANHLESEIHAHTNVLQMFDLQRSFSNLSSPLLSPGRRLLKTGLLRKLDRRGNDQVRTFFLFNDILIHASGGEISSTWGGVMSGGGGDSAEKKSHNRMSQGGSAASAASVGSSTSQSQYREHRRFALEDVTVVGLEDSMDVGRKYGFEIRSPEKSFALYADSLETKQEWLSAIREANSNLLSDRRTLQRDVDSSDPTRNGRLRDRRISMPSPPVIQLRLLSSPAAPVPRPKLSLPPNLDRIPATPSGSDGYTTPRLIDSPALIATGLGTEFAFPRIVTTPSPSDIPNAEREKVDEGTLEERVRRWSDMSPSAAAQALANDEVVVECRVIENYSAPVWVPDSKAERCMKCSETFGVWRRRHHCRLCGSVTFVIPSADDATLDRLARACDSCYETVFGTSPDPALHQHPTLVTTTPTLGPHFGESHFFSPPLPSSSLREDYVDPSPLGTPGINQKLEEPRESGGAAVKSLASLLNR
ncbi:hypothetical protein P7C70_g8142, partial [Phenoliferia sp. Uapishka_3]